MAANGAVMWEELISERNLFLAARRAAAGKRRPPDVARFLLDLEPEVFALQRELSAGTWTPGPYRSFTVRDPKPRVISAAPFRDRVVHHAFTQVVEPLFERRFVRFSFACRKGLGTHKALDHARSAVRRFDYALKCDIAKYFDSIDHDILLARLGRAIRCEKTMHLARRIVGSFRSSMRFAIHFPGDDLFTPLGRTCGLPLGNQTSQFFANVYLDPLDHFVMRRLRPGSYVRYVDDFVLFGDDREALQAMRAQIVEHLYRYRLSLHARKSRIYRTSEPLAFLGWQLSRSATRIQPANARRFHRRLRLMAREYAAGRTDWPAILRRIRAWIGHARWGRSFRLREAIFEEVSFVREVV